MDSFADLFVCPACRRGRIDLADTSPAATCSLCAATYPVRNGVLDLLPGPPAKRSLAQLLMESHTIVRIYESRLWRRNPLVSLALGISFDEELALILRAAALAANDTVLDLACGPGIYTRALARQVTAGRVIGLDLSLPMLRYASRRARELDNLRWIHGTAMELPLPDERFALVNCCGALHLFPDVPHVLLGIHRVLRPGGRFTLAAFSRPRGAVSSRLNAIRRRLSGLDAFDPAELEAQLGAAGFGEIRRHHEGVRWLIMSARRPS